MGMITPEQENETGNNGYTLAEVIPALLIFAVAGTALLAGLSGLLRLSVRPEGIRGGSSQELLADAFTALSAELADLGSDPWERDPEAGTEISEGGERSLTFRFIREGQPEILCLRCDKNSLLLETDAYSKRVPLPEGIQLEPFRDPGGRIRGILLCRKSKTEPALFIPFGRQTP